MSIIVHIWKGKLPERPLVNALYGLDVGHASMTIKTKNKQVYISHRPNALEDYIQENREHQNNVHDTDDSKKYLLSEYVPKGKYISFNEECTKRKRNPTVEIYIPDSYLNEDKMFEYYERYIHDDLAQDFCMYHVLKNNCCSTVANFIRQGLGCKYYKKRCSFCSNMIQQKRFFRFCQIIVAFYFLFAMLFQVALKILDLPNILLFNVINLIVCLFGIIIQTGLFFNLEYFVSSLFPRRNFWSPSSIEVFVRIILKKKSSCKRKFWDRLGF